MPKSKRISHSSRMGLTYTEVKELTAGIILQVASALRYAHGRKIGDTFFTECCNDVP